MRTLVTGGAGFIGSNLAKRLEGEGHETVAADDFSSADWRNLIGFSPATSARSTCRPTSPTSSASGGAT